MYNPHTGSSNRMKDKWLAGGGGVGVEEGLGTLVY